MSGVTADDFTADFDKESYMADDLLLGIDIGTQGVKGVLVNGRGKIVASANIEHRCDYPQPGWVEHDMWQNWWANPVKVIRRLLETDGVQAAQVKAVFPSGLHPNFGPADERGEPLSGAILYSDNRAVAELQEINSRLGLKLTSEELTPKLVWFIRNKPELAGRMRKCFDAVHYLVYKLTGEYVSDTISVGGWGAIYESPTMQWREDVCGLLQIPREILPPVYPPLTIAGTVHPSAADETGLRVGTPVMAGTNDVTASTIGAGALHTDEAIAYYGTAGLVPVMKMDMEQALRFPFPVAEKGNKPQEGYLFDYPAYCLTTGDSLRWFRDEFGSLEYKAEQEEGGLSAYARFDLLAEKIPPGADGLIFLPYLLGQRSPEFNPDYTGVIFGLRRMHTRGHVFRALLESWGYTIRYGLETYYPEGHSLKRLIATGGGAHSKIWRQIVSDITGIRQEYAPDTEGCVADAYLAGMAIGWFTDFKPLLSEWIWVTEETCPDPERHSIYTEKYYKTFIKLHELLKPFDRQ